MKVLLRWTCWADTFDYSIGSRGVSDNCTALALLKGGVVISAMYNTFIHFSAVPDLHHDTQAALIIPCVLARRWGDTECIPVRASQKQMRWERLLRSEPSRGGKKSWEGSCQSRKEGRKCRKKGACECWQQWIYCGNTYYKCSVSSFCSSFCFLDLFLLQPLPHMPFPSSLLCHISSLPEHVLLFRLSQVPWLFKQASGGKEWLHVTELEGVGKKK